MTSGFLAHVEALGMSVNWEKSLLHPKLSPVSLDSVSMQARLTVEQVERNLGLLRSVHLLAILTVQT
jgi:hypothetical protein